MNIRIGWTQNVVILETDLSMELRDERIVTNAHEMIDLAINEEVCYIGEEKKAADQKKSGSFLCRGNKIRQLIDKYRCRMQSKRDNGRRWIAVSYPIFIAKQIIFM